MRTAWLKSKPPETSFVNDSDFADGKNISSSKLKDFGLLEFFEIFPIRDPKLVGSLSALTAVSDLHVGDITKIMMKS